MARLEDIKFVDWQPKLNEIGETAEGIDDINQCIKIILTTPRGAVPHRVDFGSNLYLFLDNPTKIALPNIIRETTDAILLWEQRIEIVNVKVNIDNTNIIIQVQWALKEDKATGSTAEVVL